MHLLHSGLPGLLQLLQDACSACSHFTHWQKHDSTPAKEMPQLEDDVLLAKARGHVALWKSLHMRDDSHIIAKAQQWGCRIPRNFSNYTGTI